MARQIMAIVLGGIAGYFVCRAPAANTATAVRFPVTRAAGIAALTLFVAILAGMPILAAVTGNDSVALFDAFARAGALVFGGGHVVLPLLQSGVVDPGWVTNADFLAGYGAAQAVPGPLFTLAAFLGGRR